MKNQNSKLSAILFLSLLFLSPRLFAAVNKENSLPELIPRKVLFGNPVKRAPKISPDGERLAYLAPSEKGVMNVWVQALEGEDKTMVTHERHQGIRTFYWADDSMGILYLQDSDGDENFHVYHTDLRSKLVRDLTPFQGIKAVNLLIGEDEILVGLNLRTRQLFDMYRVNLETGAVLMDTENPGNVIYLIGQEWITDQDFVIRAAKAMNFEDGSTLLLVRKGKDKQWSTIMTWPMGGTLADGFVAGFTDNGKALNVLSSAGYNTARILKVDVGTGELLENIASDERCSPWVDDILSHPKTGRIQAVAFDYMKPEWRVLDRDIEADFQTIQKQQRGHFTVQSRDRTDTRWIVSYERDDGPVSYYLYDRKTQKLNFLFDDRPELKSYTLARVEPIIIKARDGLDLVSYLTLPVGAEPKCIPMVLFVHGGPTARDEWCYDPHVQLFANRGCAVLQVNFRGSVGFGKKFQRAGDGQIGVGRMQHDLTDAVRWAIQKGIADPTKIAIYGGSYGGYATLAGLAFTPELYACGAEACGPSNIKTLMESIPPYLGPLKKMFIQIFGDAENDDAYNRRISPLFHVQNIKVPLLIGQGANDPRCNIRESDQIVQAMRENNLPITYVVYPDEGHGFNRPENNLDFFGRVEEFFGKCLGTRYQPYEKIPGSTGELR